MNNDNNKYHTKLSDKVKNLPPNPGIYRFYDIENKLLYVGKAKNLKKRVSSYFNKNHENFRLRLLVKKITHIEYVIVSTEQDALLLENNLIKQHKPKYNIQLKDDKTYPWICIKNEPFPRVFSTRNRIEDGSIYFGPYTSAYMVKTLLNFIKNLYQLRNCKLNLTKENIRQKKFQSCLEYQIRNCKAPCIGLQSEDDYNKTIDQIKHILKGNLAEVSSVLKNLMKEYATQYKFEEAELIKHKIEILEKFQSKSTIVSPKIVNLDVFTLSNDENFAVVNYLKISRGAIIQSHNVEIKKQLDESPEEILLYAIIDLYSKIPSNTKEILVSSKISDELIGKKTTVPKLGDKKKLLDLSLRNAIQYKLELKNQYEKRKKDPPELRKLKTIQSDLRLSNLPVRIECFDNSNLQGSNAVSACVVFKNAKPSKRDYRHFNIKTVEGPDDFASMKEVLERRYKRLLDENQELPNLIIIDGGKGQLSSAYEILIKLNIQDKIAIIGIAKRLEEIFYPNDPVPLYLNKNSETLKVIQQARDEAHRFGITHHRNKRSKEMLLSEFDNISGIGSKTKQLLLKKFKTVDQVKLLDYDTLSNEVGKSKAKLLVDYFNK